MVPKLAASSYKHGTMVGGIVNIIWYPYSQGGRIVTMVAENNEVKYLLFLINLVYIKRPNLM